MSITDSKYNTLSSMDTDKMDYTISVFEKDSTGNQSFVDKRNYYGDFEETINYVKNLMHRLSNSPSHSLLFNQKNNEEHKVYEDGSYELLNIKKIVSGYEVINLGGDRYDGGLFYEIKKDGDTIHKGVLDGEEMVEFGGKKYDGLRKLAKDLDAKLNVIESMADGGETTVVDDFGSMSFRNQYDEYEMVVVSKELEKDGGSLHKNRFLVSAKDINEAKKIATELWQKEFGHSDLSIVKVMSDELYKMKYMDKYASGGMMADGGVVGQGFRISEMRDHLRNMFPDSFGFTVNSFSNDGNKNVNISALVVNQNEPYRGLNDEDIKSKLYFPQYKRDHDIRFRIYQGGENTYFYFVLDSENGDQYIGQFGFKDGGDVPSQYITKFIAFLMEQYGLPFDVKHSVMEKGGMMAKGGVNKNEDVVYIKFRNAKKNFNVDTKYFRGVNAYQDAVKWGRKNLSNFNMDMVKHEMADGGQTKNFSEREFKDILDEALEHFYMGINKIDLAMRYLEVRGQAGLKNSFAAKIGVLNLKESIEKIEEYTSK
jgi:hypothetical protein